jgi:predicted ATPase
VIGKEFSLSLLKQVVGQSEDDLLRQLSHLQTSEFIYERPAFPDVEYTFKHALTQEVAYNSLLVERRKVIHERAAQAIEEVYRSKLEDRYSELAHHYSRSGNTQKAVDYLQLAGQQEVQRSANAEAINHLTTALGLLKTLPDTPERAQQELTLQLALGVPLMATKGFAAPEVGRVYNRARELCGQVGETPQLFPVLWGLWSFYGVLAEWQTALELGERLLGLARRQQDPPLFLQAHYAVGVALSQMGEFIPARMHLEQSIALYDSQQHRSHAFLYGFDPGVASLSFMAWTLWYLGYPDQALKGAHEALALAQDVSHPFSLGTALNWTAELHQYRREIQAARGRAEAAITLSTEQGFQVWLAFGTVLRGWTLVEQGQGDEGIGQIRQGLAAHQASGGKVALPYWLALLAEAYGKVRQTEEGLNMLAEALALVDKTGERFYEAELYRLKGELTLAQSSVQSLASSVQKEAEECFLRAIDVARHQQAKSWELRAVMSLARLWQQQGKQKDAHQILAEIYGWFTEGFDTKDLQEAKALLEELSH